MTMKRGLRLNIIAPIAGLALFAAFTPAYANLLVNGNFSQPGTGCQAGTMTLPGWTVVSGNIDIESSTCSGIVGKNETYFLDLTGSFGSTTNNDMGVISQTVTTVVGQQYTLGFYFGGNPQAAQNPAYPNDSTLKAMTVYINGSISGVYSVQTSGVASTNAQWTHHKIVFTAASTSTTLTFESLNGSLAVPSDFGPLLDDVVLNAT